MLTPVEAFAEVGDLLQQTVKKPYRDTPMTEEEWDVWVDRIMQLAAREKGVSNGNRSN